MKTEKELNEDILKITMKIQKDFPELSKYLIEMPVKASDTADPGVKLKNLKDYYDSLEVVLKKFAEEHTKTVN